MHKNKNDNGCGELLKLVLCWTLVMVGIFISLVGCAETGSGSQKAFLGSAVTISGIVLWAIWFC